LAVAREPERGSVNLLEACSDPNLFARWFRDRETWAAWLAFIAALFAHRMTEEQAAIYRECTGRQEQPADPFSEAWLVIGRRGGKSFIMALVAVFLAAFRDYRLYLAPGERATVMVIATDRRQARTIVRYARALLQGVPMLARMVERDVADAFDLTSGTTIEVGTASYKSVRGYTVCAALLDEIAFFPTDDAAEPDYAIPDALRPAMATIPTAMLLCASSPHARRGALWDAHRRYFGKQGAPVLVWHAPTRRMNPTVPQAVIDAAMERDEAVARADYLAEFRHDIEAFVDRDVVEACVSQGVRERGFVKGVQYHAFVDPSGGANDSFTLAIGHRDGDRPTIDVVRERKPPFSPGAVIAEYAVLLRSYGIRRVHGDRYAGEFPREHFRRHGVEYVVSDKVRSELYINLLPNLNTGVVDLLDNPVLVNQIVGLERRVSRGGREMIDHAPGSHDDLANAVAGAVWLSSELRRPSRAVFGYYGI
jgi:hypothetical protein